MWCPVVTLSGVLLCVNASIHRAAIVKYADRTTVCLQGLEWRYIMEKRYAPPYQPKKGASPEDTSAFDDYSKLPPVTHPFPLTHEQQKLFAEF